MKRSILTAVNESVVVLLEGLVSVAVPLEENLSDALGLAIAVVAEVDFAERANGSREELL